MKVNELMLGDWVEHDGGLYTIVEISDVPLFKSYVRLNVGYAKQWTMSAINPIPITIEILEKNGFTNRDAIFDLFGQKTHWGDCYDCKAITSKGNDIRICYKPDVNALFIKHEANDLVYFDIVIKYVHELQHALKLCGIDKEIIL